MGLFDCKAENTIYSKRNYSLATNPVNRSLFKFQCSHCLCRHAGSLVTAGAGSSYMFNLKPGDEVRLTGPFGDFLLKQSDREMIYLGGGAGMAPLRSHLSYLFETEKTSQESQFLVWCPFIRLICFIGNTSKSWSRTIPNFSFHVALSEPKPNENWNGGVGSYS